jgi:hypothetical protein
MIQVFTRPRNIDSKVRTPRFDCFKFEFHSGAVATFATISALSVCGIPPASRGANAAALLRACADIRDGDDERLWR